MFNEIDFSKIDTGITPPQDDTERQYYYMAKLAEMVALRERELGRRITYCLQTFGCQMNEKQSEVVAGIMDEIGFKRQETEDADVVIYNTCTVRENANLKVYGRLGKLHSLKKSNPDMKIALFGCMMQEKQVVDKIQKDYPFVNLVFGTHNIFKFAELFYEMENRDSQLIDIWEGTDKIVEELPTERNYSFKSGVNIMFGCNNFCSYCIVPYVRGRERSRKAEDILKEVQELADKGYKEITLLGQNVNSYMRMEKVENKNEKITSFAELLYEVNKIEGIERIRFVSPHPKDFTDDVIEAIKKCDKVCKLIHLPLQSGNTKVLKEMNRKYTKEQYLNLVEKMKKEIPNVTFSTDIIVGFPGETDEEFEDTLDVVEKVNFEQVYMFIYSRRVGTPADKMENQVPEEQKHIRFNKLKMLVEHQIANKNKQYIDTKQKVLVEGKSKNNDNMLTGRTDSNKVVIFEGEDNLIGKVIDLKIVSEHMWYLKGKIKKMKKHLDSL